MLVWFSTAMVAIIGGLYAALADLQRQEWPGPTFMVMVFTFALAFLRPSSGWLTGILIGLMFPLIEFVVGDQSPGSDNPSARLWPILNMIPALIGSLIGTMFRLFSNRIAERSA